MDEADVDSIGDKTNTSASFPRKGVGNKRRRLAPYALFGILKAHTNSGSLQPAPKVMKLSISHTAPTTDQKLPLSPSTDTSTTLSPQPTTKVILQTSDLIVLRNVVFREIRLPTKSNLFHANQFSFFKTAA